MGLICRAIRERKLLAFTYEGEPRVVEPHCHGTSRAAHEVLRAYQIGGGSTSGQAIGWKMFRVDAISGLNIVSDGFPTARPGYNANDSQMTAIHCHL